LRKLSWAGKGKGKSGGYRVIYYHINASVPVYLLAIYPKSQQVDLTPRQKTRISALAMMLKAEALKRKRSAMSDIGDDLIRSMENALAHARGKKRAARKTVVAVLIPKGSPWRRFEGNST
jgi:hypothetical protein